MLPKEELMRWQRVRATPVTVAWSDAGFTVIPQIPCQRLQFSAQLVNFMEFSKLWLRQGYLVFSTFKQTIRNCDQAMRVRVWTRVSNHLDMVSLHGNFHCLLVVQNAEHWQVKVFADFVCTVFVLISKGNILFVILVCNSDPVLFSLQFFGIAFQLVIDFLCNEIKSCTFCLKKIGQRFILFKSIFVFIWNRVFLLKNFLTDLLFELFCEGSSPLHD